MHEHLDLHGRRRADSRDIPQRHLAREHDAREAQCRQRFDTREVVHAHLRARMQRELRHRIMGELRHAEVLHEHGIHMNLCKEAQILLQGRQLLIAHDGIDRDIDAHVAQVRERHRPAQAIFIEVAGIGARAEVVARQIDRIGPALHGRHEGFLRARGRK